MTVTGLTTVDISTSTDWQQAILFFLMCVGNLSAVSVTMVLIRRHFFKVKFDDVIKRSAKARKRMKDVEEAHQKEKRKELIRLQRMVGFGRSKKANELDSDDTSPNDGTPRSSFSTDEAAEAELRAEKNARKKSSKKKQQGPLRADMVRRMDQPAVLINPAGMPSKAVHDNNPTAAAGGILSNQEVLDGEEGAGEANNTPDIRFALPEHSPSALRRASDGLVHSPEEMTEDPLQQFSSSQRKRSVQLDTPEREGSPSLARSAEPARARFEHDGSASHSRNRSGSDPYARPGAMHFRSGSDVVGMRPSGPSKPTADMFPRTQTIEFSEPLRERDRRMSDRMARSTALSPNAGADGALKHRSTTLDMDRTPTAATTRSYSRRPTGIPITRSQTTAKERGFGGFPTPIEIAGQVVKRAFPKLQAQMTRTMTIPQSATFASTHSAGMGGDSARSAPYLSFDATVSRNSRFQELTEAQRDELGGVEYRAIDLLAKILPAYWFMFNFFFITLVAPWLANRSASARVHEVLDSQGDAAPNSTWMWFFNVVSAYSNTGLSLIDTSMSSLVVPKTSRMYETLRFLLDHPRRCFVYLFPSGQTWFLLAVILSLTSIDWVAFQVLDIGNATIEGWSIGQRIFDGLFQSIAVRAAGFQVISMLTLAPAVQFLYIVMMYISAYPIAMSVRNTNVYEERSLGVYSETPNAADPPSGGARVWGTYLAAHARRQLAFDIWWLGFALWLVCIIERGNIDNPDSNGWFTVFYCLFELTSAYGTVGLSTGTPFDNFSLSGRFSTLSKLVVIVVMLRGRHRGLPVAIDRAVLLPGELEAEDEADDAYTLDEEGFLRTRSFAPTSSANFLPRTPTGIAVPGTPGLSKGAKEKSPPALDIGPTEMESEFSEDDKHPLSLNQYPHLAAIREATPSPSATPAPLSRGSSYTVQREQNSPLRRGPTENKDRVETASEGSSASSPSLKGKERAQGQPHAAPQMLGSVRVEQLPSAVDSARSEENAEDEEDRLNKLDQQYRERYGYGA